MKAKKASETPTSKAIESWVAASKGSIEPTRELSEFAQRTFEKVSERNLSMFKTYLDFGLRGFQLFGGARDPGQFLEQQAELAQEVSEKFISDTEAYFKLTTDTQVEFVSWVEKATESAVAQVESSVSQVEETINKAA